MDKTKNITETFSKKKYLIIGIFLLIIFFIVVLLSQNKNTINTKINTNKQLLLATTTSTYDSGLLDFIIPNFEKKYNYKVNILSVGTGQALKNGEDGNVDILLVHSPESEKKFMQEGYGLERSCVMYNDFIILGPIEDAAKIKGLKLVDALNKISEEKHKFISRGDDSGTHKKELELWSYANISIEDKRSNNQGWYLETGSGMSDTLRIAYEKNAYTLSDRATYNSLIDKYSLTITLEDDKQLLNPYGLIIINPKINPNMDIDGAKLFQTWIMSNEIQDLIGTYEKNGHKLFNPLRGECIN